ncbi:MAG: cytochrome c [Hyphomonadaceae bacterium]|nr:cytochrome c [Hyphomonadaceae bacterium]
MLRVIAGLAALTVCTTLVWAQNPAAIDQRKQAMKALAGALKDPVAMSKGEAPFDLAKVQASLKAVQETAAKAKGLFPDDSKAGETDVLPVAFDNKADLMAKLDKLVADAQIAATAIKDDAGLKAELPKLAGNCGGCHKAYRKPKS